MNQSTEEQIRTRAYYLWEAEGCPQGRDWEYWLKAKQELEVAPETHKAPAVAEANTKPSPSGSKKANSTTSKRRNNARTPAYA